MNIVVRFVLEAYTIWMLFSSIFLLAMLKYYCREFLIIYESHSLIAKVNDKDLTTWKTYLKEKKQKKKKKSREVGKAQESDEEISEIVILLHYHVLISLLCANVASEEKKKK